MGRQIWPQRRNLRSGVSLRSSTAANACGLLTYAVRNGLQRACGVAVLALLHLVALVHPAVSCWQPGLISNQRYSHLPHLPGMSCFFLLAIPVAGICRDGSCAHQLGSATDGLWGC